MRRSNAAILQSLAVGGKLSVAEGATLTLAGRAHEFGAGSKVSSAGTIAMRSGVTQLDGDALISSLLLQSNLLVNGHCTYRLG